MNRSRGVAGGSSWLGAQPTRGAIGLLVAEVGVFLLYMLLDAPAFVPRHLALTPRLALGREPWQLITSGLVHLHFGAILFNAFSLWIFGTAVEQHAGRRKMLTAFIAGQLGGALAVAAVGRVIAPDQLFSGCGPGVLGLIGAFGVVYGRAGLSFFGVADMRGRTMALVFIGFTAVPQLFRLEWLELVGTLVGATVGAVSVSGLGERLIGRWERLRMWRLRRRYKVIAGGRDQRNYLN